MSKARSEYRFEYERTIVSGGVKKDSNSGERNSDLIMVRYESGGNLIRVKAWANLPSLPTPGEWFLGIGYETIDRRDNNNPMLSLSTIYPDLPITSIGAEGLFASTFNFDQHAISKDSIKAFVQKRGPKAALMAERTPSLLLEMSLKPDECSNAIITAWNKRLSRREPIRVMEAAGVSPQAMKNALNFFRDNTMAEIKHDPYTLMEAKDFPFEEADKIGQHLKIGANDRRRIKAGLDFVLGSNTGGDGSTYTEIENLFEREPINSMDRREVVKVLMQNPRLQCEDHETFGFIAQARKFYEAETLIANKIADMLKAGREKPSPEIDAISEQVLNSNPDFMRFDEIQRAAVMTSAREKVAILTGGPGTGKSTVTEAIAAIAKITSPGPVLLAAPTGKAGVRLKQTTKEDAVTVHKLLGATGEGIDFNMNEDNQLPSGCTVIIDESSMLDVELTAALLKAIPDNGKLLLVGDRFQLPSVGAGYVLGDLINAVGRNGVKIPTSELLKVYRSQSDIASYAAEIREGTFVSGKLNNLLTNEALHYDLRSSDITDKVASFFSGDMPAKLGFNQMSKVAILCPQRSGAGGTKEINERLTKKLNPRGAALPVPSNASGTGDLSSGPRPRIGDRVMFTKNNSDVGVMNGDVGFIKSLVQRPDTSRQPSNSKDAGGKAPEPKMVTMIEVKLDDEGGTKYIPLNMANEMILAYAITSHKSQGSQYDVVIMPISSHHQAMLDRTLVYTAWTRAKKKVVLIGEGEVLDAAILNETASKRKTRLKSFLTDTLARVPPAAYERKANEMVGTGFSKPAPAQPFSRPTIASAKSGSPFGRPAMPSSPRPAQTGTSSPFGRPSLAPSLASFEQPKTVTQPRPSGPFSAPKVAAPPFQRPSASPFSRPSVSGFGRPKPIETSPEPEEEPFAPRF